ILGVLQTPLDDRFIEQVKKRWNTWHSGQRKTGKPPALKDACNLAENLGALAKAKQELAECESKFVEIETLLRQAADLEQSIQELNRQLDRQNDELQKCRQEHKECQSRLLSRQQAENDFATAELERTAALDEQRWRAE